MINHAQQPVSFWYYKLFFAVLLVIGFIACSSDDNKKSDEQIRVTENGSAESQDSLLNSIQGNLTLSQIPTFPNSLILTGIAGFRLVPVYKIPEEETKVDRIIDRYSSRSYGGNNDVVEHFMPGIDILYGYNLLNIAHYDMNKEKLKLMFNNAVLVKTIYYPAFVQDSIDKKPITRDYFLISVYDEDTNKDTLLNKADLRRLYCFTADCSQKTQLIPADYSVIRSQYDPMNDAMFVFARHDENKNGYAEAREAIHIFWFSLKIPAPAKRLY